MKTVELPPIKESTEDYERLQEEILKIFREEIYLPMLKEVGRGRDVLRNSTDDILSAIRAGQIAFHYGRFTGKFNAAVSRELKRMGAKWNKKRGSFDINQSDLPIEIINEIRLSEDRFKRVLRKVDDRLSKMLPEEIADKIQMEKFFDTTLWKTDSKIKKTLKGITVSPTLTDSQRERIAKEYAEDVRRYIKDWTEKEIGELRGKIQSGTFGGIRYEEMIKTIQTSYNVSQNKAKFLARQETNLLMSKFKEVRYQDAGIGQYKWCTVAGTKDHPVRPMHKALAGKIFSWNNPPVTDDKGSRNNPGQDFGCRCYAKPIVKF